LVISILSKFKQGIDLSKKHQLFAGQKKFHHWSIFATFLTKQRNDKTINQAFHQQPKE
jgi:hypothetical protein